MELLSNIFFHLDAESVYMEVTFLCIAEINFFFSFAGFLSYIIWLYTVIFFCTSPGLLLPGQFAFQILGWDVALFSFCFLFLPPCYSLQRQRIHHTFMDFRWGILLSVNSVNSSLEARLKSSLAFYHVCTLCSKAISMPVNTFYYLRPPHDAQDNPSLGTLLLLKIYFLCQTFYVSDFLCVLLKNDFSMPPNCISTPILLIFSLNLFSRCATYFNP